MDAGFACCALIHFDGDFFDLEIGVFQDFEIGYWFWIFLWVVIGEFGDSFDVGSAEARGRIVDAFAGEKLDNV